MAQRGNALLITCKCGCGKQFKPKRIDQLFFSGHKKPYFKKANEIGVAIVAKFGTDVSVDNITKVNLANAGKLRSEPMEVIPLLDETERWIKKKKTFNARNVEGSKPLQRMLKLFNRGGQHSTMALNSYLTVTCASTMVSELNWNFNKRHDLPKEYHKYRGMEIVSSTKRIKNKTVWFYKLLSGFEAFEHKIIKGASKQFKVPIKQLKKPIPKRG